MTTQIGIALTLGLSAFMTFIILRTKWSQFYMSLGRQRGLLPPLNSKTGLTRVEQEANYRCCQRAFSRGYHRYGGSQTIKS